MSILTKRLKCHGAVILTEDSNNKLKEIAGLSGLINLKKLDLGANRIRVMNPDELSGLVNLEELWIGKNKIEEIDGLQKVRIIERVTNQLSSYADL